MTEKRKWLKRLKRLICWWHGHTSKPKDGTYTGTIMHMLINTVCSRCERSFNDIWNQEQRR